MANIFDKKLIILTIIILILAILNPSIKDFAEFLPSEKIDLENQNTGYYSCDGEESGKEFNFVVFSIYIVGFNCYTERSWLGDSEPPIEQRRIRYLGVLKNFLKIEEID